MKLKTCKNWSATDSWYNLVIFAVKNGSGSWNFAHWKVTTGVQAQAPNQAQSSKLLPHRCNLYIQRVVDYNARHILTTAQRGLLDWHNVRWKSKEKFSCYTKYKHSLIWTSASTLMTHDPSETKSFQKSRRHLKILGARTVKQHWFPNADPQILIATVQNVVTRDLCAPCRILL